MAHPEDWLELSIDADAWQAEGDPALELELSRGPAPPGGGQVFLPLRLPDRCRVQGRGPLATALRRGVLRFKLSFAPGVHDVPLSSGEPVQVEFAVGAVASGRVRVDSARGGHVPLVQSLLLDFQPPLVLRNLVQTLRQVQEIVSDRRLAPLRSLLGRSLLPRIPGFLRDLGSLALGSADVATEIMLERVVARPEWRGQQPVLPLRFSGRVRWMDQLETRFDDVALPAAVLPLPHAALERLLSAEPLATADFVASPQQPEDLARALLDSLQHADAELDLVLRPPPVRLRGSTIDGARISVEARTGGLVHLTGQARVEVSGQRVALRAEGLELGSEDAPREQGARVDLEADAELDLDAGDRPPAERFTLEAQARIHPGGQLPPLELTLEQQEQLCLGQTTAALRVEDLSLQSGVGLSWDGRRLRLSPRCPTSLSARVRSRGPAQLRDARTEATGELDARVAATLEPEGEGCWSGWGRVAASLSARGLTSISTIPELDIHLGVLASDLQAQLELNLLHRLQLKPGNALELDLSGSSLRLELPRLELALEGRQVQLPAGSLITARLLRGGLSGAGPGELDSELGWELPGRCLLHHAGEQISLLTPDLRSGQVTLHLDRSGRLRFEGDRHGLYGAHFFNALLNPASDPEYLFDLLKSDDALARVIAGVSAFAPDLGQALADLRLFLLSASQIFNREGIKEPRHLVPREAICRTLSLLLVGDDSLQPRLTPIVKRVTDGGGLDLVETKALLQEQLGDFDIDYELGAALHWLNLVLSPSEPVLPPPPLDEPPLSLDPALAEARQDLPSAAEIYAAVDSPGGPDPAWGPRLARLAPRLARRQLGHVLGRLQNRSRAAGWDPRVLDRLRYVYEVKRRVERFAECFGGPEYGLQPLFIGAFLGEAVGPLPGLHGPDPAPGEPDPDAWPPPCALSAAELAILLQAGMSTGRESRRAQLNNRLLLELMRQQPPELTLEVMVELGQNSPRLLSGLLYAFLDQSQDQMASELDLPALLSRKLGLEVPRQADYMAGGRRARDSYYEALSHLAEQILDRSRPYLARKQHLQVVRHPAPAPPVLSRQAEKLERKAIDSVARADDLGHSCSFDHDRRGGPRSRAREAYRRAFRACGRLLRVESRAFQQPWFKEFWLRNEEALKLLSVVRGYQQDRDHDRRWLHVQTGRAGPIDGEQELLRTAVETLYWDVRHRELMLADPLARLLLDPEPGRYRFSIVSCMGVITDGQEGAELERAYQRLEQRRGVRVLRAHTGTARSLEYNAERIIEAIESCDTPWGIIGYSQGCANALRTESMLLGGPPGRRGLLNGLVCRNLLFSSANGSAHGTSGMLKFQRALVLGERYLKHYQSVLSWEAVEAVLSLFKAVLDSRLFVHVMGGVHSLTFERARDLFRDGQFLHTVPTSFTNGVITAGGVPETLEFLFHVLNRLTLDAPQDTQVLISDAIGRSTRVRNAFSEIFARCDMKSYPQSTHHWAPLTREVEFVTTPRDVQRAVYQSPKDRLVWPWVEVNARFERIQRV